MVFTRIVLRADQPLFLASEQNKPHRASRYKPGGKNLHIDYVHVIAVDQNELRQLDGLKLNKTFPDKVSDKNIHWPELELLLSLYSRRRYPLCHSMDRMGLNLDHLCRVALELTGRGAPGQFLKEGSIFTGKDSPVAPLVHNLMGLLPSLDRCCIVKGQTERLSNCSTPLGRLYDHPLPKAHCK